MKDATSRQDQTAVVLASGDPSPAAGAKRLPAAALVIAADGGLAQAASFHLTVDIVIGDMDSVDPAALDRAAASGTRIERHPPDKDATDLELALDHAMAAGCRRVIVLGGGGGRLDHLLGNALVLSHAKYESTAIEWWTGSDRAVVVRPHDPLHVSGRVGDLLSLLPIGGAAVGVRTTGLRWKLQGVSLESGSTRGISNELADAEASVSLRRGALLAIHRSTEQTS